MRHLRKSGLPNGVGGTLDDVVVGINHNADIATELTRRAVARGRIKETAQAFGTHAHKLFERLNRRLNRRLIAESSSFRITAEQFRDSLGNIVTRRARGSIGADALIFRSGNSNFLRNFDLKTHGGIERLISPARQIDFLSRFGIVAEEIFRLR